MDWTGGQIKNNDSSDDVKNVDLSQVHYLSGPITVEGAQPGDLLKVEFLNLGPLDDDEWVSRICMLNLIYCFILPNHRCRPSRMPLSYFLNLGVYWHICQGKRWWFPHRSLS